MSGVGESLSLAHLARLRAAAQKHFKVNHQRGPMILASALALIGAGLWRGLSSALALTTGLWCGYCAAFVGIWAVSLLQRPWAQGRVLFPSLVSVLLVSASIGRVAEASLWHLQGLNLFEQAVRYGWHVAFIATLIAVPLLQTLAAARRLARSEAARAQVTARLLALQAQIEPHFLFNTLAALRSLIRRDGTAAAELLDRTTEFLRAVLPSARQAESSLAREVDIVDFYLAIMQARLGGRLSYTLDIEPSTTGARMPPLLLQPLVENAVQHGIEPSECGGVVRVSTRLTGDVLSVEVRNTGDGLGVAHGSIAQRLAARTPTGLANIRDRLSALFAGEGSLTLGSDESGATVATLRIPFVA